MHALQDALTLTPLDAARRRAGLPAARPAVAEDLRFFEQLRVWSQAFPPAAPRRAYAAAVRAARAARRRTVPYAIADPELDAPRCATGLARGHERLEDDAARTATQPERNGWTLTCHVFDYNLDYFELGTIDDARNGRSPTATARYVTRAPAARGGLWGNHGYEAAYAMTYVDTDGEPLDGAQRYTLRFDEPPPVNAFWSITMYDIPEFFLVANPIDRYSIGDRTPGLRHDDDGSLTSCSSTTTPATPSAATGCPPRPATSGPSCACTRRAPRSSTTASIAAHRPARLSLTRAGLAGPAGRPLHAHELLACLCAAHDADPRRRDTRTGRDEPAQRVIGAAVTGGAFTRTA